jgi:hypothetical protein
MKLSKFLSIITCVTLFALFYVWQQTEIFRLAYVGQKNQVAFQDLLDKNTILRYNISRNVSLVRIGNRVSQGMVFQMPDTYRVVRLIYPKENLRFAKQVTKRESIAFRLFGIKRQAEAKTINPSTSLGANAE